MTDTIADLKQQLRHLEALAASGALPEDAARTAREDLQRRLVAAVLAAPDATAAAPAPAAMSAPPVKHSPRLIAGLAGFAVLFAIGGYAWLGNPEGMKTAPASGPMAAAVPADDAASSAHPMTMGRIEGMVASLAERLKSRPDDAEGWLMLGRSQAVLGKFDLASPDVIHSFWVPAFLFKMDVVPGRINSFEVTPNREGTFAGKCAELCGVDHSRMLFNVKVVPQAEFDAHMALLRAKGQTGVLDANRINTNGQAVGGKDQS